MKNWDTAIATVSVAGELEDKLQAISEAGFTGYELFETDLLTSNLSPESIRKLSADLNLIPYLYQPFRDFEGVIEPVFLKNLERAKRKFELMNRLGIGTILACSNVLSATENNDELFIEQLGRMGDVAQQFEINVAYEALAWSKYVSTYDHSWRIVEQANHPNVGICLDSFHIYSRKSSLDTINQIPGEKIFFIQLADAQSTALDLLSWSRHHRLFPGEGEWNLKPFVQKVLASGYNGPMSLEVFNDIFRQKDSLSTAVEAKRSLIILQQKSDPQLAEAGAVKKSGVFQPKDFSFLELKTSAPERAKEILKQLGFQSTRVHRTRWAQLWTNGQINIVMRADSKGESGIFSFVGFGVDVENIQGIVERADNFQALPNTAADFFDTMSLEGFVSPGGEQIFLSNPEILETLWSTEFIEKQDDSLGVSEVEYAEIDHIAIVQPWEQLDETRVYYRNIFGLKTNTSQFLPDSFGLVKSVSMHNTSKDFRLALNSMPNRYYFKENEGTHSSGHIAFLSDDLISDLKKLTANGLELLEISPNYYEDLEARFDFDASLMADLRQYNILYDRDAAGGFLHAYTPIFGNVFFEIVERIGNYDGYGAANAPVRMAAARKHHSLEA
ncbi:MAG: TIM barrel protein [Microbacteriaceae bacterium]